MCTKAAETFAQYGNETAALLVEPLLQGSAGMKVYPPLYLRKLRELCDEYNVHLIADEIATGYGRTGKMFAFEHAGVSPDIMCLSKGLTGGYMPMALFVTTQKYMMHFMMITVQEKLLCTAIHTAATLLPALLQMLF